MSKDPAKARLRKYRNWTLNIKLATTSRAATQTIANFKGAKPRSRNTLQTRTIIDVESGQ